MRKYSNELYHYRTKGSRNGFTKYSWYTPIGEKAKGPEYWQKQRGRYSGQSNSNVGQIKDTKYWTNRATDYLDNAAELDTNIRAAKNVQLTVPSPGHKPSVATEDMRERRANYLYDNQRQLYDNKRELTDEVEQYQKSPLYILKNILTNPEYRRTELPKLLMSIPGQIKAKAKSFRYKLERMLSSKQKDPETGFRLKSKNMSADDDMARVNPEYTDWYSNTKSNCMLCTTTYELRRRGYDVTAAKASEGYDTPDLHKWFNGSEIHSISRKDVKNGKEYGQKVTEALLKDESKYARGNLMVTWVGGGGHSMVYEVENGEIIIRDCQINKKFTIDELFASGMIRGVQYMRMDNIEIDPKYIKEVCS